MGQTKRSSTCGHYGKPSSQTHHKVVLRYHKLNAVRTGLFRAEQVLINFPASSLSSPSKTDELGNFACNLQKLLFQNLRVRTNKKSSTVQHQRWLIISVEARCSQMHLRSGSESASTKLCHLILALHKIWTVAHKKASDRPCWVLVSFLAILFSFRFVVCFCFARWCSMDLCVDPIQFSLVCTLLL